MEFEAKGLNSILYAYMSCVSFEGCGYKISQLGCEVKTLEGLSSNEMPSLSVDASNGRAASIASYL